MFITVKILVFLFFLQGPGDEQYLLAGGGALIFVAIKTQENSGSLPTILCTRALTLCSVFGMHSLNSFPLTNCIHPCKYQILLFEAAFV